MRLGIDFGTSFTKIGFLQDRELINPAGKNTRIPSVVSYLPSNNRLYFGNLALRINEPGAITLPFFKLQLKRNPRLNLGPYSLQDIMTHFFTYIRREYLEPKGWHPAELALSVPNYFGLTARRILQEAAQSGLGAEKVYLIPEPVAALLGYNHMHFHSPLSGDLLSIDIGGGTTDFSFISLSQDGQQLLLETQFQVGSDAFSGSEIDRAVLHYILFPALQIQSGQIIAPSYYTENNLEARERFHLNHLLQISEQIKIEVSQKGFSYQNIADFYNGHSLALEIDHEVFERQLQNIYHRLEHYFKQSVTARAESLGLFDEHGWKLDNVFLLGGASQTHGVKEMVSNLCPGVKVITPWEGGEFHVVQGLCAWMELDKAEKPLIKTIYPFDFYIENYSPDTGSTLFKIPFDLANLELDTGGKYRIFSFPVNSSFNLAVDNQGFYCRVYEIAEEEPLVTIEKFMGQEIVLSTGSEAIGYGEVVNIVLDLAHAGLELETGPADFSLPEEQLAWWRTLQARQISAANSCRNTLL
ncbi:Hsp70 family protein [Syntrophomonas palmitatica]|uniref:Hsp70 family protein n=1 Tax=Syntrophomonas palmitatica TaxID=402877 RepID=UPI000B066724|nr:Hsp70 family protein [Syntrophomonas palmitatica]